MIVCKPCKTKKHYHFLKKILFTIFRSKPSNYAKMSLLLISGWKLAMVYEKYSKSIEAVSLTEAIKDGRRPCKYCH